MSPENEVESVEDFLASRGIESLATHPVMGHDGQTVPLAEALASCGPARNSIDSTIETIRELAGESVDVLPALTRHLERMGETAQSTNQAATTQVAEKK